MKLEKEKVIMQAKADIPPDEKSSKKENYSH